MTQSLRRSQYVTTYGPGAILESSNGPRLLPSPDIGLFKPNGLQPASYEILDQRVTAGLLGGAHVFRLPSNAEAGVGSMRAAYRTRPFPEWRICLNSQSHKKKAASVLYIGRGCPECGSSSIKIPHQRLRTEPIRFVAACPNGHLDDVDWYRVVHQGSTSCTRRSGYHWLGGGSSLSRIWIECPGCGKRINFGDAYADPMPCRSRQPEREPLMSEPFRYDDCKQECRITQRQAANLRLPDLKTLFSIPPRYTELSLALQRKAVLSVLVVGKGKLSQTGFKDALDALISSGLLAANQAAEILQYSWDEIQQASKAVLSPIATRYQDLLQEEFGALIQGSIDGVPARHERRPDSPIVFEIDPHLIDRFELVKGGRKLLVTPVTRLRTVTVQVGYRREVDTHDPAKSADVALSQPDGEKWYPGVEYFGEGLFLRLADDDGWHFPLVGKESGSWRFAFGKSSEYPQHVFRTTTVQELHPVFVWWHTLAHLLIRSVSIEAGYSTAAIRERVYLQTDGDKARGGVLLYATQPGSEGSMGGLIALVKYFVEILSRSRRMLESCSSDPLCSDTKFGPGMYNGSACYGCLLPLRNILRA